MSLLLLLGQSSSSTPAFDPGSLSGLTQRFLDEDPTYYGSTVNSYPVLTPEETGTVAQPRGQRCALFDGSNDFAALGTRITSGSPSALTFSVWLKTSNAGVQAISGEWFLNDSSWLLTSAGAVTFILSTDGTSNTYLFTTSEAINTGAWVHLAFSYNGSTATVYINGAVATGTPTGSVPASLFNSTASFQLGTYLSGGSIPFTGSMRDARVYSSAKSLAEIQAIYNQSSTPSTIDTTGLLGMWSLQEESGTTAYDASGNGKHLTLTNITQGTFHATDTGMTWNPNNWKGHTASGSVIIPQNLASPTLDAAGNALGVAGPVAHPATMEVPCITGNGSVYADLGSALIPASSDFSFSFWIKSPSEVKAFICQGVGTNNLEIYTHTGDSSINLYFNGSVRVAVIPGFVFYDTWTLITTTRVGDLYTLTATNINGTVSASATVSGVLLTDANTKLLTDTFNAVSSGSIADFRITTGGLTKRFPLQEGPGTSNTNRDLYWIASDGTSGISSAAIVNGTVATIWANRCPYAQDHFVNYGGRVASGVAIPGRLTGSLAADDNALTHIAGKHGNPYSRICPNTWSAPELVNIGSTSSTKLAPTDTVQSTSPVDTKFRRTKTDGDDRYFAVLTALTGTDKTNAEGYVV